MSRRVAASPDTGAALTLARFSGGVRLLHWVGAVLIVVCGGSGAALPSRGTSELARHHSLFVTIHVASGYALGLALIAGLGSAAFRTDIRALSRITAEDRAWLRAWGRRAAGVPVGKFNAGQKVRASLTCGALLVLLGTGALLDGPGHTPSAWRTGAGWVHGGVAMLLGVLVLWHVLLVLRDPVSLVGMIRGRVSYAWARRTHDRWAAETVLRALEDGTYAADAAPVAEASPAEPRHLAPAARPPADSDDGVPGEVAPGDAAPGGDAAGSDAITESDRAAGGDTIAGSDRGAGSEVARTDAVGVVAADAPAGGAAVHVEPRVVLPRYPAS